MTLVDFKISDNCGPKFQENLKNDAQPGVILGISKGAFRISPN
jgi:hypothetical protein